MYSSSLEMTILLLGTRIRHPLALLRAYWTNPVVPPFPHCPLFRKEMKDYALADQIRDELLTKQSLICLLIYDVLQIEMIISIQGVVIIK